MKRYPTADDFFYHFEVDTDVLGQYVAAAVKDSVFLLKDGMKPARFWQYFGAIKNDTTINFEKDFAKSEKLMKARIKATIGRNLFETSMFYRVINSTINNVFAKAVEVINSPERFEILKAKDDDVKPKGENKKVKEDKKKKRVTVITKEKEK
jgi:hypothetical protein